MNELILKKRDGGALSTEEIRWMVSGCTDGSIPDYQMSAMLMAICFQGMDERETLDLTLAMRDSGGRLDLSAIQGVKADKHSTGGVGDKTSLLLCPMLAACGVKLAKMSGRGLGHTGGTIDKLESFPGFSAALSAERFLENVSRVGFAIAGQTANLCPADKKLYALRDVTGTVASRPLIVSSILSKKLAAGADVIVLDVKCGSGAFMQTDSDALELAREMVKVGRLAGKKTAALVSDMDEPLGFAVGNALEVREALDALRGRGPDDLMELCLQLGALVLESGGLAHSAAEARERLEESVRSGAALERFAAFVEAQGGDRADVMNPSRLPEAPVRLLVPSANSGWVEHIDAAGVGMVSMQLGGGRAEKDAAIDLAVGVVLKKKCGDRVEEGECLGVIHAATEAAARDAAERLRRCYRLGAEKPAPRPFIHAVVR